MVYDLLALSYPQVCAICGGSVEERRFGVACEACWNADADLQWDGDDLLEVWIAGRMRVSPVPACEMPAL